MVLHGSKQSTALVGSTVREMYMHWSSLGAEALCGSPDSGGGNDLAEDDADLLIQHSCDSKVSKLCFGPSAGQEDVLEQRESRNESRSRSQEENCKHVRTEASHVRLKD